MKPSLTPTVSIIVTPTTTLVHRRAHFAAVSGGTPLPLSAVPAAAITSPIASASSHS